MSVERNKTLIRHLHEEVWTRGNAASITEIYALEFICHLPAGPRWMDVKGAEKFVIDHRTSFPDWSEHIDDIIAEGDEVVTRYTSHGTHKGEFMGFAPTNKQVWINEISIYRIADGKVIEQWAFPDMQGLLRQIQGSNEG